MNVTQRFIDAVSRAWGNPNKVAEAGINETFSQQEYFGLDHDDQVANARRIGVLAGLTASQTQEAFIEGFKALAE